MLQCENMWQSFYMGQGYEISLEVTFILFQWHAKKKRCNVLEFVFYLNVNKVPIIHYIQKITL